jgi:uncharacterized protein YndB with AHSA1/START domain
MTVTHVQRDPEALTMTIVSEFEAPITRVWQLWENPRLLERWWGPPTYPATFVEHELAPGAHVSYYMTGPEGDRAGGWWRVLSVDAPNRLEFEDGFADDTGEPSSDMPVMIMRVELSEDAGRTRMSIETAYPSAEAMEKILTMGMEEGLAAALGQIDDILEEVADRR